MENRSSDAPRDETNQPSPHTVELQTWAILGSTLEEERDVWLADDLTEEMVVKAENAQIKDTREARHERFMFAYIIASKGICRVTKTDEYHEASALEYLKKTRSAREESMFQFITKLENLRNNFKAEADLFNPDTSESASEPEQQA